MEEKIIEFFLLYILATDEEKARIDQLLLAKCEGRDLDQQE